MKISQTFFTLILFMAYLSPVLAQESKVNIYNPDANAKAEINASIQKAVSENKQVLIQVGGNWCSWCLKLHNLFQSEPSVDSLLRSDYIWIKVNYSKENKNPDILKELEYPQRFGFPVLVILDQKGRRIHTQDSGLLESGNGYDAAKIIAFLKGWNVKAVNGETLK